MPIDGILFTSLSKELNTLLTNGRIQNIFQPASDEIVFQIRQPGRTFRLVASVHPQLARIHLTNFEQPNPLSPPAFCLLLRKHLIPGRILGIEQISYERCLTMRVESFGPTGERRESHVIFEVMGRHSNIIVVNASTERIIDALKRIPGTVNSYREILPHRPYILPPPQDKVTPNTVSFEQFDSLVRHLPASTKVWQGIQRGLAGFSPFAARELLARSGLATDIVRQDLKLDDVDRLWQTLKDMVHSIDNEATTPTLVSTASKDEFWSFSPRSLDGVHTSFDSVNELLDYVFTERVRELKRDQIKRSLEAVVEQRLGRVERKIRHQQDAVEKATEAKSLKRFGDLITANLYQFTKGPLETASVQVVDYFGDGRLIEIPVDPTLSASQNAQKYFKRYQKARKTEEKAAEHLRDSLEERDYLHSVQLAIDTALTVADLEQIRYELQREGYIEVSASKDHRSKRDQSPVSEPLKFESSDGFTMFVGRNNRQNDEITLRRSRPEDLWFHTKEIPGAHVIVVTNNQEVPETTLIEAGQLAALHSKAKLSSNVPVDYTRCRYVRKPRGAKPGMVIYEREKTLWITPDENVVKGLKAL